MTPLQHAQPGLGAPDGSGRRPCCIAIGRQVAATCHLAGTAGLPARKLRPPPMRRRRTLVAELLDGVGLQPGGQEGVDLRTGQGPRRSVGRGGGWT